MLMIRPNPSLNRLSDIHRFRDEMSRLIESFGQQMPRLAATFPATNAWRDDANAPASFPATREGTDRKGRPPGSQSG
jgi:hypothetical protein